METIKHYMPQIAGLLLIFFLGAFVGVHYFAPSLTQHHYAEKITENQPIIMQGETKTVTDTQIAYVPKETVIVKYIDAATGKEVTSTRLENTDLQANIGKTEFNVKLNGKDVQFKKANDEKYLFDKNKISLQQENKITFDAKIEPYTIDKTKRWGVGVGYSNNGTAYTVDFPIGNSNYLNGWVYKDDESKTVGVKIKF